MGRHQANKLSAREMDVSGRAVRKPRMAKIRNLKIRKIVNLQHKIIGVIEERRLNWFGHLKRTRSNKIPPKMMLEWNAEGRSRHGKA